MMPGEYFKSILSYIFSGKRDGSAWGVGGKTDGQLGDGVLRLPVGASPWLL